MSTEQDPQHEQAPPEGTEGNSRLLFFAWLFAVFVVVTVLVLIWIAAQSG
jgi:hypothetical protein